MIWSRLDVADGKGDRVKIPDTAYWEGAKWLSLEVDAAFQFVSTNKGK